MSFIEEAKKIIDHMKKVPDGKTPPPPEYMKFLTKANTFVGVLVVLIWLSTYFFPDMLSKLNHLFFAILTFGFAAFLWLVAWIYSRPFSAMLWVGLLSATAFLLLLNFMIEI